MSLLLEDILQHLVNADLYQGLGIDAFWDKVPEAPDSCIVAFEYDGLEDVPWEEAVHRSVQLIIREPSAVRAQAVAMRVYSFIRSSIDDTGRIDFNGRFTQTTLRQTPFKVDEDDNARVVYGFNMGITTSIDF